MSPMDPFLDAAPLAVTHPVAVLLVQIVQALLTPVIALTTVYIAYQQLVTNRQKLTFDKYDRRVRIYEQVTAIIRRVTGNFKPDVEDFMKFRAATAEADFLYGPEIAAYLDEIVKRGCY